MGSHLPLAAYNNVYGQPIVPTNEIKSHRIVAKTSFDTIGLILGGRETFVTLKYCQLPCNMAIPATERPPPEAM